MGKEIITNPQESSALNFAGLQKLIEENKRALLQQPSFLHGTDYHSDSDDFF